MRRSLCFTMVLSAVAGIAWQNYPEAHWTEMEVLSTCWNNTAQEGAAIDAGWERNRNFKKHVNEVLDALWRGKLTLVQAADAIHGYAEQEYPVYLEALDLHLPGRTLHQKVARNIIRHFRMDLCSGNLRGVDEDFLQKLERDFEQAFSAAGEASEIT